MPTDDWFAAKKFPKATFVTTGFKALGGDRYQAAGNLTIRGVSKPITLPFTLTITGNAAHMTSAISLNRTVFGVGQGQFATGESVPLDVAVNINLSAHKAP
jgi:polyisoprenoid-binding protein YceI